MKTSKDIIEAVKASPSSKVKLGVCDIDGILRGKVISRDKFLKAVDQDLGFCDVVFGWDANDAVYDNSKVTGWHTGFPDAKATIDLSTFREIPWNDDTPFFLADFHQDEAIAAVCPRSLLKRVTKEAHDLGFKPKFSNEFEWFNFRETPDSLKQKDGINPTPLTPGMFGYSILRSSQNQDFFDDIFNLLGKFGVPIEGLHTETGDGVYEAAITYTDILEAADRAILFKTGVKEIAYRHEIIASFMAKWNVDLPGCSGHIHQSLWNEKEDANLFFDETTDHSISKLLEYYIAGLLYCMPYILPMYAPTVNSYKRMVEGSWAATSVSWGIENRTTALRVINHGKDSMRLETRIPGADANPYLSMAASLASGLYGIKNKLSLEIEATTGNEYAQEGHQPLPRTLAEATQKMKNSDLANTLFGEEFTDHFIRTREWEWRQFTKAVTDWELKRYFEII
ncbi:MAG: glutamine synthetase [Balneola sp.]|mgnify:CR=1 FL=1|nr:glutamine synthetase [Balneola sp.]|tara:strand:+ start:91847 stop:93205 length:1359 start_codon:yes stop_codon:yes gene_type:complete